VNRGSMRRSGQLIAGTMACMLAVGALAAEPEALEARTGLDRVQLGNLVGCIGTATSQLSLAVGMFGGDTPEQTQARAEEANQRLPEHKREAPAVIAGRVAEIHAVPRKRLHEFGAASMTACARQAGIPIEGSRLGRCFSLVSFVNSMLYTNLGGDTAETFADSWAPELARTPAEVLPLRRVLAARHEKGVAPPMREVAEYLACATDPALKDAPLIAPLPTPAPAAGQ